MTDKSQESSGIKSGEAPSIAEPNQARWLFGALALAVYVMLLHWNTIHLPLIRDEGEYAYAAWMWSQGLLPYTDAVLQKPPMILYIYRLGLPFDDGTGIAFRWLAILFTWLAGLVMGAIAGKKFGDGARWPARLLLPALMLMPGMGQAMANTETFMLLPILLIWWLYVSQGAGALSKVWFLAGCIAGMVVMYKYTGAAAVAVILGFWLFETHRTHQSIREVLVKAAACVWGGIFSLIVINAPFLIHDGGQALWESTVGFNGEYAKTHLIKNYTFGHFMEMGIGWAPLIVLSCVWLVSRRFKEVFWLIFLLVCAVSTVLSPYQQYYMVLLPCLAFAAAGACVMIQAWLSKKGERLAHVGGRICIGAVVLAALAPNLTWLVRSRESVENHLSWAVQFKDSAAIAKKIDSLTTPQQRVLIAGSEPQILYMAKRRASIRYMNVYSLMIPTSYAQKYQWIAIEEINQDPPAVIVVVVDVTSWLTNPEMPLFYHQNLNGILERDYTLLTSYCQTEKGPVWVDDAQAATHPSTGWIVFVRKPGAG